MKVLLVTHNPICTNNNMGKTFLSLFSAFRREQLCQLYVHPFVPDVDICSSYFQITDQQVVKANFFGKPGREVPAEQIVLQVERRKSGTLPPPAPWKGANPWKCLLRDGVWRVSNWYSSKLKDWLDREAPTAVFVAPGYSKFIYNIALKIAKDRKLPVVTYICDDYYFLQNPTKIGGKWHLSALRKKTDQLMKRTDRLVTISRELGESYAHHFGVNTEVIMTGAQMTGMPADKAVSEIKKIAYFGNLSLGRHASLAQIGQQLDQFNSAHGKDLVLHIYTGETDVNRLAVFQGIQSVKLCNFVSGQALQEAIAEADMLVHTESFEPSDVDMVKYSVSTKIADSLASGVPLLAYGPETVASMGHLIRNQCAVTATSAQALESVLEGVVLHPENLADITKRAVQTALQYHNEERNSLKLLNIFTEMEGKADE